MVPNTTIYFLPENKTKKIPENLQKTNMMISDTRGKRVLPTHCFTALMTRLFCPTET